MKKLLVLLLVAAMATLSCSSDPEPPVQITEWDFTLLGGDNFFLIPIDAATPADDDSDEFKITGGGFRITAGKTYTAAFIIEAADEDFYGNRFGAKLLYADAGVAPKDESGKILTGWTWSTPTPIIEEVGTYRWTFVAGDKADDDKNIGNGGTTPDGSDQYFFINVQNNLYGELVDYEFRIKGRIEVKERELIGTLTSKGEITLDFSGSGADQNKGIGNIQDAQFTKVQAARGNGAFLRFSITVDGVTETAVKERHAVGAVGNLESVGDNNPNPPFRIPSTATVGNNSFTTDIEIETIFSEFVLSGDTHIFVNLWTGGETGVSKCTKIELFVYE